MPTLSIIHGFIASGKTTFSKKLAQETGALRLNADEWVAAHFMLEEQMNDWGGCFSKSVLEIWDRTEILLHNGKDVILDIGFWDKKSRDNARKKAQELNSDFKHYYIFAPDHILLERMKERTGPIAEKNLRDFTKIKALFQPPEDDEKAIIIS